MVYCLFHIFVDSYVTFIVIFLFCYFVFLFFVVFVRGEARRGEEMRGLTSTIGKQASTCALRWHFWKKETSRKP